MARNLLLILALQLLACGDPGSESPQVFEDFETLAFLDGVTDGDPVSLKMSEYLASERPDAKIIMLTAAAGWCVPCMREATALPAFAAANEPQGVAILVAVFQDQNGDPAGTDFVKAWVDNFELEVPVLIDTSFQISAYIDVNAMPANIFVNAETLEILTVAQGAETGDDPMRGYQELIDHYLQ